MIKVGIYGYGHLGRIFAAHRVGSGKYLVAAGFRTGCHLSDAGTVPQVDKDYAAMVTAFLRPAGQDHFLPHMLFAQIVTVVCTF